MKASRTVTNRMARKGVGKPRTKSSKAMRQSHRHDDVNLLKQDLKYNLKHAADHKKQAQKDKKLIRKKS